MSGNGLSTVDNKLATRHGGFQTDCGLKYLNSGEGLVTIDPYVDEMVRKYDRQVQYRLRRDESLSRDDPPRLPCRPWYNNGDENDWEDVRRYHQPRVYQEEIDPKHDTANEDTCYTCMDHRLCTGPVCEATVLRCTYCHSEKGPLRVRQNKEKGALARKLDWDSYKLKPLHFFKKAFKKKKRIILVY